MPEARTPWELVVRVGRPVEERGSSFPYAGFRRSHAPLDSWHWGRPTTKVWACTPRRSLAARTHAARATEPPWMEVVFRSPRGSAHNGLHTPSSVRPLDR